MPTCEAACADSLQVLQVKYSILDRAPEADGTVAACRELGVSVIAHSPLEQGVLTTRGLDSPGSVGGKAEQVRLRCRLERQIWSRLASAERDMSTAHSLERPDSV